MSSGAGNTIVEEKDKDEKQSVTSISKIMTVVIAIEHGQLDESFAVDDEINKTYGGSAYLKQGRQVTMRDLLHGLMLRGGSDVAVEVTKHVADSQEAFVGLMNRKAAETGVSNTTSSNPSGLDEGDKGNISTANDTAVLMNYVMKSREFRTITGNRYRTTDWNMRWKNKNRLLFDYSFTVDGETGFIKKAGRALVGIAEHDGVENIVATLRGGDDFAFHEQKHTEVSQKMDAVTIIRKDDYIVNGRKFRALETLKVTLHKGGSDKLRVKTHYGHKNFVAEVQENDDINVYSFTSKKVRGGGLFS